MFNDVFVICSFLEFTKNPDSQRFCFVLFFAVSCIILNMQTKSSSKNAVHELFCDVFDIPPPPENYLESQNVFCDLFVSRDDPLMS